MRLSGPTHCANLASIQPCLAGIGSVLLSGVIYLQYRSEQRAINEN